MKRYEYEIGPTGQISYAAPSGYHDDCVMALAFGVWGCHTFGGGLSFQNAILDKSAVQQLPYRITRAQSKP